MVVISKRGWLKVVLVISLMLSSVVLCGICAFAKETITLRISTWVADPSEKEHYERWAKEYMAEHPDIKVVVDLPADYFSSITVRSAGSTAPDLVRVSFEMLPSWVKKGIIMPLPEKWLEEVGMEDLQPIAIACGTYGGKFYGWDTHMSGPLLHYDRSAFDQAGLSYPNATWTWDDMAKAAGKLVKMDNKGQPQRYGVAWFLGDIFRWWQLHTLTLGGKVLDDTGSKPKLLFPSSETLAALEFMYDLTMRQKVAPQGLFDERQLFYQGRTAMLLDGQWMNPYFSTSENVDHSTEVLPRGNERACVAVPCIWSISAQTKHPRETWELYKFWVGKKNNIEFTAFGDIKGYGVPVWKSALRDPRFRPCKVLRPLIDMLPYMTRPLVFLNIDKVTDISRESLWDAIFGRKSASNALTELRRKVEGLL